MRRPKDPTELSAAEWVRQQLIDDIVVGRLRPGERLCEMKIAARLGCSRTPVREAFRHLGALGLAHFEKNRGGVVVQLERAVMLELFEALAEIASTCAGLVAARGEAVRHELATVIPAEAAAPPAATGAMNDLFTGLFHLVGNRVLAECGAALRCRLLPYWRLLGEEGEAWASQAASSRAGVVEAVAAGAEDAARASMRAYVLGARDLAVRALPRSVLP